MGRKISYNENYQNLNSTKLPVNCKLRVKNIGNVTSESGFFLFCIIISQTHLINNSVIKFTHVLHTSLFPSWKYNFARWVRSIIYYKVINEKVLRNSEQEFKNTENISEN